MRLYQQLVLFMLAATVLPLAVVGFWLLRQSERELAARIGAQQRALALAAAEGTAAQLMGAVNALERSAGLIDWSQASEEEVRGGLSLLYQQSPLVTAVLLERQMPATAPPLVFLRDGGEGHPGFDPDEGPARLRAALPLDALRRGNRGQVALSPAYLHSGGRMAAVAVAIKLDAGEAAPFVLAELGLGAVSAALVERAGRGGERIDLLDGGGRIVASSSPEAPLKPLPGDLWAQVQERLQAGSAQSFAVRSPAPALVSAARVPDQLGLFTVARLDEHTALAPVRALRRTVLVSIGGALLLLLAIGSAFTRRINARLRTVAQGAEAFSRGELGIRVPVQGADELTELSETFNRMGGELEQARARLMRWNDELRQKVDEATAELRAAQAQLVEAQKLAAIGQLGAGVAHEINNPLCGILGNAQLLMLDRSETDPDFDTLKKIEQSAKRCKEITQNLLRFAQARERSETRAFDLNAVVRDVLSASQKQAAGDGVELSLALQPGPLMAYGDPGQLAQVVQALVSNACTAMLQTPDKRLTVTTRESEAELLLEVRDTGKGIRPEHLSRIFEPFFTTKDVWSNVGLGLSVAYRVITDHKGRIDVTSEVGKGATFTVRLPRLSEQTKDPGAPARPLSVGGQGVGITG